MADSYIIRLETLRIQLRDILRDKGFILSDNATLTTMIPLVGGIGDYDVINDMVSLTGTIINDQQGKITSVNTTAFREIIRATKIILPSCTTVPIDDAFRNNSYLTEVSLPVCTSTGRYLFKNDSSLAKVELGAIDIIREELFSGCAALPLIDLPATCYQIKGQAFYACTALKAIILRKTDGVITLDNVIAFGATSGSGSTPFRNGVGGVIYVPDSLISSYEADSKWGSLESATFKGLSELD